MKGMFIIVADISPAGKNKTKLDVYRITYGTDIIASSIKNWATGKSLACPDMTNQIKGTKTISGSEYSFF